MIVCDNEFYIYVMSKEVNHDFLFMSDRRKRKASRGTGAQSVAVKSTG